MLELYHTNWSTCSQKARLVIAEKGLEPVEHHLNLRAREQQDPAYLKLNPGGYVPTLVHDGQAIPESAVIAEYLEDVFPDPPLAPADPAGRAAMRLWTRRPDDGLHRACATCANAITFRHQWLEKSKDEIEIMLAATPDPARRAWRREMIEKGTASDLFRNALLSFERLFDEMEETLSGGPWLMGEAFTLADIGVFPYIHRIAEVQLHPLWERSRPRVTDWYARFKARPSYRQAVDGYPYDDFREEMRKTGEIEWSRAEAVLAAQANSTERRTCR